MKRLSIFLVALFALIICETPPQKNLQVGASAEYNALPDVVYFSIGIQRDGYTAQEAQDTLKKAIDKVVQALQETLESEKIKTDTYTLYPIYKKKKIEDDSESGEISKYRAYARLTCELSQATLLAKMLDRAVEAGANRIEKIDFSVKDPQNAMEKALTKAIERAESKAKLLADKLQVRLISPVHIDESTSPYQTPQLGRFALQEVSLGGGEPLPSGMVPYTAQVNLIYEIEPLPATPAIPTAN